MNGGIMTIPINTVTKIQFLLEQSLYQIHVLHANKILLA
jgi:hypothetical protein